MFIIRFQCMQNAKIDAPDMNDVMSYLFTLRTLIGMQ